MQGGQCSKIFPIPHPSTHLLGFLSTEEKTCACTHLCIHTQNVHLHIRTHAHTHPHVHMDMHTHTQTCTTYTQACMHLHTVTQKHMHIQMHRHMQACTHRHKAHTPADMHMPVTQLCMHAASPLPPQHNEPGRLFHRLGWIKCQKVPGSW